MMKEHRCTSCGCIFADIVDLDDGCPICGCSSFEESGNCDILVMDEVLSDCGLHFTPEDSNS